MTRATKRSAVLNAATKVRIWLPYAAWAALGCGETAREGTTADSMTAGRAASAAQLSVRDKQLGELNNKVEDYGAKEFYDEVSKDELWRDDLTSHQRWCKGENACGVTAKPMIRSHEVALDRIPANGVVMAWYQLQNRDEEEVYKLKRAGMNGYFLVVTPANTPSAVRARWQLVGIRRMGNGNLAMEVLPGKDKWGRFIPCDSSHTHTEARAGFESCETKDNLFGLAASNGTTFARELDSYRDSLTVRIEQVIASNDTARLKGLIGGPMDFAWTTCAAGCCRAHAF